MMTGDLTTTTSIKKTGGNGEKVCGRGGPKRQGRKTSIRKKRLIKIFGRPLRAEKGGVIVKKRNLERERIPPDFIERRCS